jgi:hypothetical protein
MSDLQADSTIHWLRSLAVKGGKGVVNNVDARCLGRIADKIEQAAARIRELEAKATPVCIGRNLIGILAKEGAWQSSTGQCVVAADELFGSDPYERAEKAEAERDALKIERDQYVASLTRHGADLMNDRDAIEAATIERCAAIVETFKGTVGAAGRIALDIRALKAPEKEGQ